MNLSARFPWAPLFLIACVFTACDSTEKGATPVAPDRVEWVQGKGAPATTSDGKLNMSAHTLTIHQLTAEMVNLMDDVSAKKIMNPPLKVSDVRNAFMARLDWIEEMSAEDVAMLRQATADLGALLAEIRSHENAKNDAALEARLKKIEDWNRSIKEGLP